MNHSITMLFDFTRVSLAQLLRKIAHLARGSACCVLESRTAEDLKIGKRGRPSRTTCSVNWTWRRIFPPSWGWSWGAQPLFWSTCGQLCSVKTGWLFHGFPSGDRGTWQMIHCICSGCFWIQSDLRIEVGMSCWSHKLKAGCAACSCSGLSGWCLKRVGMFPLLFWTIGTCASGASGQETKHWKCVTTASQNFQGGGAWRLRRLVFCWVRCIMVYSMDWREQLHHKPRCFCKTGAGVPVPIFRNQSIDGTTRHGNGFGDSSRGLALAGGHDVMMWEVF